MSASATSCAAERRAAQSLIEQPGAASRLPNATAAATGAREIEHRFVDRKQVGREVVHDHHEGETGQPGLCRLPT